MSQDLPPATMTVSALIWRLEQWAKESRSQEQDVTPQMRPY